MLEPDELVWLGFEASSLEETEVWLDEVDDSLELLLLDSLDLLKLDLLKLDLLGLLTLSLDELFVALSFGELHATKENDKARNKDA
ncbi:hypothetical protein [Streptococcus gordonii]|uniref:hypothetical protein n=1 Tax=Streptococcus gordonii TaxID=1302 RepID=UPI001CBF7ED8|nr:hypothetical protein [Streptococcus gordonii]